MVGDKVIKKLGRKNGKFCCFFIIQTLPYRADLCVLYISGPNIVDPGSLHGLLSLRCGISNVHGMLHKRYSKQYVFKSGLNHLITLYHGNFTPLTTATAV